MRCTFSFIDTNNFFVKEKGEINYKLYVTLDKNHLPPLVMKLDVPQNSYVISTKNYAREPQIANRKTHIVHVRK